MMCISSMKIYSWPLNKLTFKKRGIKKCLEQTISFQQYICSSAKNLDVRAVNMGINLIECAGPDIDQVCEKIHRKIVSKAGRLVPVCEEISAKYGIPIVNKRLALSPVSQIGEGHGKAGLFKIAKTVDNAAKEVKVDLVGGFTALVQKGMTPGEQNLIESLPDLLSKTDRICSSVNVASTAAGINMDAILLVGKTIKKIAKKTAKLGRVWLREISGVREYP